MELSCTASAVCAKNRAAGVQGAQGDKQLATRRHRPRTASLAHGKGRLPLHAGDLDGGDHASQRTLEDVFLRKFMQGTIPGCPADKMALQRRANQADICALVLRQLPAHGFYSLVGCSETTPSHLYKCPLWLRLQAVPSKVV